MAGIYPMFQVPTGDTRLGPDRGKEQVFLPLWLQWDSGQWTAYGGSGYRINPGAGYRNDWFHGVTLLYQLTDSLQLGGEVFHQTPDTVDSGGTTAFNLGGSYKLAHDYNLLFSAGRALNNPGSLNQLTVYLAVQALY
jgi:hypothetical protein